jgi:hypothetical protein
MSPEQESQFKINGCGCRCLIAIAGWLGKPISKADFIDRFSGKYTLWHETKQCGVTNTEMLFSMAKDLGLATTGSTFINKDKVRELMRTGEAKAVILVTEKRVRGNSKTPEDYYHCALVRQKQPHQSAWLVSQAWNDMTVPEPEKLSDALIDHMRGYFVVLI